MAPAIQDTLFQLFEHVRHDPETFLTVPVEDWQEGSAERRLLESFHSMLEQVQRRTLRFKQAEQQLREREEQYRSIFEATYDGLNILDLDGFYVEVNPAFCRMFGYTREELIGMHASINAAPQSFSVLDEALEVQKSGQAYQVRGQGVRKDGTVFTVEAHSTPFIYKGKLHTLAVTRDITEQVEAEQQLQEKEEQYRSIFEAATDSMTIAKLEDGQVVEANPAAYKVLGYTYEELIGLSPADLVPPDSLPLVAEGLRTIQAGGRNDPPQMVVLRKDGTSLLVEAHSTHFTYKGEPHFLTVSRDITERVEAEKQLHEREEQYRSIFEETGDGLVVFDMDGFIVEANPAACRVYGCTYEELVGLHASVLTHPESLPLMTAAFQTVQAGGQFQKPAIGLRKDGTSFYGEGHATPFTYKGKPHMLVVVRDVTEHVQAEQQLREKEEQYRGVFEATYDALFIMDLDGFLVEVNPAFCRMFGYPYEEVIGLHAGILTAPVSLPGLSDALKTLKTGRGTQVEVGGQGLRKDGMVFSTESQSTTFTYRGQPHALGVVRDITERVEAEKQLREKEEQYRAIFEAVTDSLTIARQEDGQIVEANPAACKMLGYSYEELIGKFPADLVPPDFLPLVAEGLQEIQVGERNDPPPMVALRKDGSSVLVEAHSTQFTFKEKPHHLTVSRDITERVEAEKQLHEREEQYRSIFESTYDGINILDLDGFFVEANPAFCRMYGYTREELIGLHVSVLAAPADLHNLTEALETFKAGRDFQTTVGQALRKDGTTFPVEAHGSILTLGGKPHSLGITRDITEQMQAQQLLEQRVEERTRELSSLLEISHTVASTLQLKPLVGLILDQLKTVVDSTGASILTLEGDELVILDSRSPTPEEQLMQLRLSPQRLGPIWKAITSGESMLLPDVRDDSPLAQSLRVGMGELMDTTFRYVRACLFVPLTLKDKVIGMLVLTASEPDAFTPHHMTLALAIANQAAIAIENARLYAQAQELAALEERQKLARELHDSVSQALYGIALGVHTARTLLDRDPGLVAKPLDYILTLAEAGLAEMRALIFELRPESLETEGLVSALMKQAAALQARHDVPVETDLCDEPDLPLKVKQELYRVAQEALHNTIKHARASQVNVRLLRTAEVIILEIRDNGRGFDPLGSFPGHLGLLSMQERVRNLAGVLSIESTPGQGTTIRARVPAREVIHT